MTTVTKALDHLTDVLAGSDVTLKGTKADCIMQLADMIEDGTIVIGGGGGGGDIFVVNFIEDGANPVADKTLAEILAAQEAGKIIVGTFYGAIMPLLYAGAEYGAAFQLLSVSEESALDVVELAFAADGTLTETQSTYDLTSLVIE